jgi:hypothetical protein
MYLITHLKMNFVQSLFELSECKKEINLFFKAFVKAIDSATPNDQIIMLDKLAADAIKDMFAAITEAKSIKEIFFNKIDNAYNFTKPTKNDIAEFNLIMKEALKSNDLNVEKQEPLQQELLFSKPFKTPSNKLEMWKDYDQWKNYDQWKQFGIDFGKDLDKGNLIKIVFDKGIKPDLSFKDENPIPLSAFTHIKKEHYLKIDATNAAYRVCSSQITKGIRAGIVTLLKNKGFSNDKIKTATEVIGTDVGLILLNLMMGFVLTNRFEDARINKLAKELEFQEWLSLVMLPLMKFLNI